MFPPTLTLTNGQIVLRPHRLEDAGPTVAAIMASLPGLSKYMPWAHPDYSLEEARSFIETTIFMREHDLSYEFLIADAKDGAIIGACGLNRFDHTNRTCNLGYWVRTDRTCRGVATGAAKLLLKFGFEELHLNRIEIIVEITNAASQRVAEKAGATRECVLRKRLWLQDEAHDAVLFAVVRES